MHRGKKNIDLKDKTKGKGTYPFERNVSSEERGWVLIGFAGREGERGCGARSFLCFRINTNRRSLFLPTPRVWKDSAGALEFQYKSWELDKDFHNLVLPGAVRGDTGTTPLFHPRNLVLHQTYKSSSFEVPLNLNSHCREQRGEINWIAWREEK